MFVVMLTDFRSKTRDALSADMETTACAGTRENSKTTLPAVFVEWGVKFEAFLNRKATGTNPQMHSQCT